MIYDRLMFRQLCAVCALFLLLLALPAAGQEAPAKVTVLVVYKPGPSWIAGKPMLEQPLKGHGPYLLSLYKKGMLKFAGPFSDNAGGALVLEVADESAGRQLISEDPAVKTGVFVYELHPWALVAWDKFSTK
jgi:uncharacterized protein YciI